MAVFPKVGAEAGRFPVDMDRLDQAVADHRLKAVVNRGERDRWHSFLDPDEDLRRRGVIPLLHQHLVDLPSLGSEPQPLSSQHAFIGISFVDFHRVNDNPNSQKDFNQESF
jgi:hypothetical protein